MTDQLRRRSVKNAALLGSWFVLVVAVGLFQWWRGDRWRTLEPPEGIPIVPVWLPVVELALVAAGFVLVSLKRFGARTPERRYWAMLFVGVTSMALIALLVIDVLRHAFFRW